MANVKISQLPDGTTLDGSELLPVDQSGLTVKVTVQDVADYVTGGGVNLDTVLGNGNVSNKNIKLTSGGYIEADGYIKSLRLRVSDGTLYSELKAPVANFTANRFLRLPDASGTLAISVNNIAPDANGNIAITSLTPSAHTHPISDIINLQTELDLRLTTADADARYYPLSSNPAGYVTASSTTTFTNKSGNISMWTNDAGYITSADVDLTLQQVTTNGNETIDEIIIKTTDLNQAIVLRATGNNGEIVVWGESETVSAIYQWDKINANGNELVYPTASGTLVLSVNSTSADGLGDVQIGLQSVTDVSFTTTNPITAGGFSTTGTAFAGDVAVYPSGHLRFVDLTGVYNFQFEVGALSQDHVITLPDFGTTLAYLPLTVNSTYADSTGNITIEAFQDLQATLDLGSTATNATIELSDGSSLSTDAYLQSNELRILSSNGDPGDYHSFFSYDGQPAIGNGTDYLYYFRADGLAFRGRSITTGNYVWEVQATSLSANRTYNLPNASGIIPISVNGNTADSSGNITISTGGVTSVSGTTNRITVTGTTTPAIDISSSYVGQSSITTLGTITTGTWHGSAIADTYISSASTWNGKQDALSGTGFVKISGTTISYDNSTYITASSTDTLTNKSGNISMWTNDSGYLTANQSITFTGDVTGSGSTSVALTIGASKVTNSMLAGSIAYSKLNLGTSIVNADINGSAAIALSKLATVTASKALVSDGSGVITASSVTSTELGYLSGVTSAIQTQISAKQDLALSAYSFRANNTGSTANATNQVFQNDSGTYSGTITWSGTTAPSGTTNHTYAWQRIGQWVTLQIVLTYSVTGSAVTQAKVDLPASAPTPAVFSGLNTTGYINAYGIGCLLSGPTSQPSASGRVPLQYTATTWNMTCTQSAASYSEAIFNITYLAA
ncbi:MAG: hypothetical protein QM737_22590 [Ferruginibacter sp.]